MKQGTFDSVLDDVDVDIEPLDIGEYDKEEEVCNTTFDVEKSAFDVDENESVLREAKEVAFETGKILEDEMKMEENREEKSAFSKSNDVESGDYYQQEKKSHENDNTTEERQLCVQEERMSEDHKKDKIEKVSERNDDSNGCELQKNEEFDRKYILEEENEEKGKNDNEAAYSFRDELNTMTASDKVNKENYEIMEEKSKESAKFTSDLDKMRGETVPANIDTGVGATVIEESDEKPTFFPSLDKVASIDKQKSSVERLNDDSSTKNNVDSLKHQDISTKQHISDSKNTCTDYDTSPSNSPNHDDTDRSETTTSPSIQADVSLSDVSQTSESSSSPTKSDSGKKKKKLLLRTTSADQPSRLRALHSHGSLDSERLSSSLNFDSRLSQRSASLLKELRNEIASLTVRHAVKDESNVDTAEKISDESSRNNKLNDSKRSQPASYIIKSADIPRVVSDTRDLTTEIPHESHETSRDQLIDSLQTTRQSDPGDQNIGVQPGIPQGSPETLRDVQNSPERKTVEGKENGSITGDESKKQSFTMPVFDDVEASLSMEDFLEDSLDERD